MYKPMRAPRIIPHHAAERSFQAQSKNKQETHQNTKPQRIAPPTEFSTNAPNIPMPAQTSIQPRITAIAMKLAKNNNSIIYFYFFVFFNNTCENFALSIHRLFGNSKQNLIHLKKPYAQSKPIFTQTPQYHLKLYNSYLYYTTNQG